MPLYESTIPNATAVPDEGKQGLLFGWATAEKASRPTTTACPPAPDKSVGSTVIIFPGGGYVMEGLSIESTSIG
jgi:hypothetical protein